MLAEFAVNVGGGGEDGFFVEHDAAQDFGGGLGDGGVGYAVFGVEDFVGSLNDFVFDFIRAPVVLAEIFGQLGVGHGGDLRAAQQREGGVAVFAHHKGVDGFGV